MSENSNITVIIPIHYVDDSVKEYYANAISSIQNQEETQADEVIVVTPAGDVADFINGFDHGDLKVRTLINDGDTDFSSQINFAVENTNTEWFSLLEFDDEFSSVWLKNGVKYINAYPEVEMFLPIIIDVNPAGAFMSLTNEAVWAHEFSDEMGVLDNGAALRYQNFNLDGMIMNKSAYEDHGGLKPSMKLTFIYEFFLRMTYNDVKVMTIPKFGYKHVNQRENSLFNNYRNELSPDESRWWLAQAKKEYFFPQDRKITYDAETA